MKSGWLLRVLLLLAVAFSCSDPKEEPAVAVPGTEYFPLKTGTFISYQVDSTRIIQNVAEDFHYQLRVSVIDSFKNSEGNYSYLLQREKRTDQTQPWKAAGTWSAYKTIVQAVVTEGNTSYIKLQFPSSTGQRWNGNALNTLGGQDLCGTSQCDAYLITSMDNEQIEVSQEDLDDIIATDKRIERYKKELGLTYKETTTLNYCTGDPCSKIAGFVLDGIKYKQEMIDSGTM